MLVHQDKSVNWPVKKNQDTGSDISASRVHSHQLNVPNIVCHLMCVCVFLWSVRWSEERRLKNSKKKKPHKHRWKQSAESTQQRQTGRHCLWRKADAVELRQRKKKRKKKTAWLNYCRIIPIILSPHSYLNYFKRPTSIRTWKLHLENRQSNPPSSPRRRRHSITHTHNHAITHTHTHTRWILPTNLPIINWHARHNIRHK